MLNLFSGRVSILILWSLIGLILSQNCYASLTLWEAAHREDWDQFITLLKNDPNSKLDFSPSEAQPTVLALVKEKNETSGVPQEALDAIEAGAMRAPYESDQNNVEGLLFCKKDVSWLICKHLSIVDFYRLRKASPAFFRVSQKFEEAFMQTHFSELLGDFFADKGPILIGEYFKLNPEHRRALLLDLGHLMALKQQMGEVSVEINDIGPGPKYGCFFGFIKDTGGCFDSGKVQKIVCSCISGGLITIGTALTGYIASEGNSLGAGLVGGFTGTFLTYLITTSALNCRSIHHQKKLAPLNTRLENLRKESDEIIDKWTDQCRLVIQQL